MRTLDILPLANDAPLADIDLAGLVNKLGRMTCAAGALLVLAVTLTGMVDLPTGRWLLIGAAPSLAIGFIWPMAMRRGLHRSVITSEPAGLWAFVAANLVAVGMMATIGQTLNDPAEWPYLLQLLAVPFMLDWAAAHARFVHWLPEEGVGG